MEITGAAAVDIQAEAEVAEETVLVVPAMLSNVGSATAATRAASHTKARVGAMAEVRTLKFCLNKAPAKE